VQRLAANAHLIFTTPGGGGYSDPKTRDPQRVLDDVVNGYVSIEAAQRDYGVSIRYRGPADALVRTPEMYEIVKV
jgi:N-methylhydantoinase B